MSTSADRGARLRRAALLAGLVALAAAVAFPFAPVSRPVVTYTWPSGPAPTAAAIPMLPYQPASLTASVACDAARATRGVLLDTVPLQPDPATEPLRGLRVDSDGSRVVVATDGATLPAVVLPPGPCTLTAAAGFTATTLTLTTTAGTPRLVGRVEGDVRPAVAGAFSTAPTSSGLALAAVGDTRFQTTITPLKAAVATVGLLALAVLVAALVALDRLARPRRRWFLRGAGRPRAPDVAVVATLALWTVIGPITIDDGYIAGIVRSRGTSGQVGTVFRWLNSPEAPFGWFYEVLHGVAALDPAPLWLRLPSSVLGVVAWVLLSRAVLPRLRAVPGRWWPWVAAAVFALWWLPWNLSVRPEPWVAVGSLVVLVLVERAVALRTLAPAVLALTVAGATLAVTPTGLIAFAPLLAALVPLARLVVARRDTGPVTVAVGALAALGATSFLVYADQTWASVLDSVAIRTLIGGDLPWSAEYTRWATLLTPATPDGNVGKRAAVLFTVLGTVALALGTGRARGVPRGPARRLAVVVALSTVGLSLTPTKWTHHFGAFAGIGTAALVVALRLWWVREPDPDRALRRALPATAACALTAGLVLAGWNQWNGISNFSITWSTIAPQLGGFPLADVALVGGAVGVAVLAAATVRCSLRPSWRPRWLVASARIPPVIVVVVVVGVVALEVLSFARTSVSRRNSYTLASDSLAALRGHSCGMADRLRVEPDPQAGLLAPVPGSEPAASDGFAPVGAAAAPPLPAGPSAPLAVAGELLPGVRAVRHDATSPATVRTGWYALPPDGRPPTGTPPLVVTVSGSTGTSARVVAEFGQIVDGGVRPLVSVALAPGDRSGVTDEFATLAPAARDLRIDPATVAPGADAVRLVAVDAGAVGSPLLSVAVPRVPQTVAWNAVLPPGVPAAVDWPTPFLFPCTPPAPLRDGLAPLPDWRITATAVDESRGGYISYGASQGGPWATDRVLVRQERLPVYLEGLELSDVGGLYRWVPVVPLVDPGVARTTVTEGGWSTPGPLSTGQRGSAETQLTGQGGGGPGTSSR